MLYVFICLRINTWSSGNCKAKKLILRGTICMNNENLT